MNYKQNSNTNNFSKYSSEKNSTNSSVDDIRKYSNRNLLSATDNQQLTNNKHKNNLSEMKKSKKEINSNTYNNSHKLILEERNYSDSIDEEAEKINDSENKISNISSKIFQQECLVKSNHANLPRKDFHYNDSSKLKNFSCTKQFNQQNSKIICKVSPSNKRLLYDNDEFNKNYKVINNKENYKYENNDFLEYNQNQINHFPKFSKKKLEYKNHLKSPYSQTQVSTMLKDNLYTSTENNTYTSNTTTNLNKYKVKSLSFKNNNFNNENYNKNRFNKYSFKNNFFNQSSTNNESFNFKYERNKNYTNYNNNSFSTNYQLIEEIKHQIKKFKSLSPSIVREIIKKLFTSSYRHVQNLKLNENYIPDAEKTSIESEEKENQSSNKEKETKNINSIEDHYKYVYFKALTENSLWKFFETEENIYFLFKDQLFFSLIKHNIDYVSNNKYTNNLFLRIICNTPKLFYSNGTKFIEKLLVKSPSIPDFLKDFVVKNFKELSKNQFSSHFLKVFLGKIEKLSEEQSKSISNNISTNFDEFLDNEYSCGVLISVLYVSKTNNY
jgi:hypothetical protein